MCSQRRSNWKRFHPAKALFFMTMIAAFILGMGWIVMVLWNWIVPDITNFKPLSYWQAVGLFVLFKILFGGFRPRKNWERRRRVKDKIGNKWNSKMKEKWMGMSEEERAEFKGKWRDWCDRRNDKI